jgi:hypothetical protein
MSTAQVLGPEVESHHLTRKPLPTPEAAPVAASLTPLYLLEKAVSQDVSIERLQQLMELQLRWEANEARKAFVSAMNRFKSNPPAIVKNTTASMSIKAEKGGGSYSYSYASLDSICRAVIQGLSEVGISHRWTMQQNGSIRVSCILTHELGHSEETSLEGAADQSGGKNSIQAVGSTVTYLQRYTLLAATGLAAGGTDTDGHVAQSASGITPTQVQDWCQRMTKAADIDQLRTVFAAAYRQATEANDRNAQAAYIAAKDARRKELR